MTTRTTAVELAALNATVSAFMAQIDRDRGEDKERREKMEVIIEKLERNQINLLSRMDKVEPVADMVTKWRYIGTGALLTAGAVGAAGATAWDFVRERVSYLLWG